MVSSMAFFSIWVPYHEYWIPYLAVSVEHCSAKTQELGKEAAFRVGEANKGKYFMWWSESREFYIPHIKVSSFVLVF